MASPEQNVSPPKPKVGHYRNWAEKVEKAKEAREAGRKGRTGKRPARAPTAAEFRA
jgi:hypothetical protein